MSALITSYESLISAATAPDESSTLYRNELFPAPFLEYPAGTGRVFEGNVKTVLPNGEDFVGQTTVRIACIPPFQNGSYGNPCPELYIGAEAQWERKGSLHRAATHLTLSEEDVYSLAGEPLVEDEFGAPDPQRKVCRDHTVNGRSIQEGSVEELRHWEAIAALGKAAPHLSILASVPGTTLQPSGLLAVGQFISSESDRRPALGAAASL